MLGTRLQRFSDGRRGGVTPSLMTRPLIASVALAAVLALPAGARAESSLLSGYAGPGGGEQVLLGGRLLPAKRGDGGLRAAPIRRATATPRLVVRPTGSGPAAAPAAAAPEATEAAAAARSGSVPQTSSRAGVAVGASAPPRSSGGTVRPRGAGAGTRTDRIDAGAAAGSLQTAPAKVPSPHAQSPGPGGLPFTARDLALLALIATILPLTAVAARRLSREPTPELPA